MRLGRICPRPVLMCDSLGRGLRGGRRLLGRRLLGRRLLGRRRRLRLGLRRRLRSSWRLGRRRRAPARAAALAFASVIFLASEATCRSYSAISSAIFAFSSSMRCPSCPRAGRSLSRASLSAAPPRVTSPRARCRLPRGRAPPRGRRTSEGWTTIRRGRSRHCHRRPSRSPSPRPTYT